MCVCSSMAQGDSEDRCVQVEKGRWAQGTEAKTNNSAEFGSEVSHHRCEGISGSTDSMELVESKIVQWA